MVIASHLGEEVVKLGNGHHLLVLSATLTQCQRFLERLLRVGLLLLLFLLSGRCTLLFRLLCRFRDNFRLLGDRIDANLVEVPAKKLDELLLLLEVVGDALRRQLPLLVVCDVAQPAGRNLVREHEGDQPEDNRLHGPARVPRLRMIVAETCADRIVDLKSALGRVELDSRRFERVILREEQCAPVKTAFVWAVFEPKD